jgi:hypothetical protein
MSQLKLVKLDEPGNSGDAYGLPDVQTSGRIRIPDEFKKKKWEKGGERKKHKKQLGQKVGYTLHHWRLKQKETHDNLIGRATSSVGKEVERHRKLYQYNQKISKLSEKNKAAARKFAQKHADRNMLIEKQRLANVQAHFSFAEYEHDYREHAHKMQTQATVDDQWMPFSQRLAASKFMTVFLPIVRQQHFLPCSLLLRVLLLVVLRPLLHCSFHHSKHLHSTCRFLSPTRHLFAIQTISCLDT